MRYTGSRCKRCRALGASLCGRVKCAFLKRQTPPGQHGATRKKISDYGNHLLAKQKIKWTYDLSEKQFFNLYELATKKRGVTGVSSPQRDEIDQTLNENLVIEYYSR